MWRSIAVLAILCPIGCVSRETLEEQRREHDKWIEDNSISQKAWLEATGGSFDGGGPVRPEPEVSKGIPIDFSKN